MEEKAEVSGKRGVIVTKRSTYSARDDGIWRHEDGEPVELVVRDVASALQQAYNRGDSDGYRERSRMPLDENTSDGYHTFRELYDHRIALFIALMRSHPTISWVSPTADPNWLLGGMNLPTGTISYHMPASVWPLRGILTLETLPPWDGHTPADVVDRLTRWLP